MWLQQNLCEYQIVKMKMEQRHAANQSFLKTIQFQVNQKQKVKQCNFFKTFFIAVVDSTTVMLIVGICLLIAAIIVGIGIALYIRRWRKKNDLELLGYPPKVVTPPPRSNLSPTTFK